MTDQELVKHLRDLGDHANTAADVIEHLREHEAAWRTRAEKAEAELYEVRRLLIECVNEGTDGFADATVSLEFIRGVPAECAGMKRQRDEALRNLSIAHSDGHHDGYRDGCLASLHDVKRIERETIERCAKVVAEIAERHGEASVKCHEEGLKDASHLASYVARSVDEIAAVIRAMREGGDE